MSMNGPVPGTLLPCRTDSQVARIVAVNGTHRPPDALAPLINVRRGADGRDGVGDKLTAKCHQKSQRKRLLRQRMRLMNSAGIE